MSRSVVVLFTGLSLVLAGCGDESGPSPNPIAVNVAPKALATGSAAEVKVGNAVQLDGSQSTDADRDPLSFAWSFESVPGGSKAAITKASDAKTSFTPDVAGKYVVALVVADGKGKSDRVTVTVNATAADVNGAPTAKVTASSLDVDVETAVTVDGSASSDPEGDALTFAWTVSSAPAGSAAKPSSDAAAKTSVMLDKEGSYVLQLVVKDAKGAVSAPASVTVKAHAKKVNGAPTGVAEASAAQVRVGQVVTLDATRSTDPDNDTLTYEWSFKKVPAGSAATLSAPSASKPTFTADRVGEYVAELVVTDAHGAKSAAASVTITATAANAAPTAVATASSADVPLGSRVTLDGSQSSDPERDTLTYAWTIKSQPQGAQATIASSDAGRASFVFTPPAKGSYVFELVVTDAHGAASAAAAVTILAKDRENSAPTARIAAPAEAELGATVTLDGSGSSDPDRDPVTYRWTLVSAPNGSTAALSDAAAAKPTIVADKIGHYVVSLVATDDKNKSSEAARVDVLAVDVDAAPNAVAKASATDVETGAVVTLDASESSDPENAPLTYAWTLVSRPDTSASAVSDPAAPKPTFTADKPGTYVFALVVRDRRKASVEARVTITASAFNAPPTAVIDASATQIRVGAEVTLDGSRSSDPERANLTYAWRIRSAPGTSAASFSNASAAKATFKADVKGFYVFELVVNDGAKASAPASVTLEVKDVNATPSALAEISANAIELGQAVTLEGSKSRDPENEPLTYAWTIQSKPAGSTAALATAAESRTSFTADKLGQYVFALVVTDSAGNASEASRVTLTVDGDNAAPTAAVRVSASQVEVGRALVLSGTTSRDPENAPITYAWRVRSRPAASTATFARPTAATPSFTPDSVGFYVFELVVNDGVKSSEPATVTVEATRANLPPVVVAKASANEVAVGGVVTLQSDGTHDPENAALTLTWTLVSKPAGSAAAISAGAAAAPTLTLDKVGYYVVELAASDGVRRTTSAPITVRAVVANAAPTASAKVTPAQIAIGAQVTLDGSESRDPENTQLTFAWKVVSVPQDSQAALSSPTDATPTFTADKAGDYVFELVVRDAAGIPSQPVTVSATAAAR